VVDGLPIACQPRILRVNASEFHDQNSTQIPRRKKEQLRDSEPQSGCIKELIQVLEAHSAPANSRTTCKWKIGFEVVLEEHSLTRYISNTPAFPVGFTGP
jgi:hypothetical protein